MKLTAKTPTILTILFLGFVLLNLCGALSSVQAQQVQVTAADPPAAAQGTINLNVKVTGKGFKNGAKAKWFVTGTTNPGGVTVNSTTFVSSGELTANITVDDAATIANFDIAVTNSDGRGGKGTELFAVTAKGGGGGSCANLASFPSNSPDAYSAFTPIWSTSVTASEPCSPASTVPGSLDTCYGSNGIVTTSISPGNWAVGVVAQPDGKAVVAITGANPSGSGYDFYAARYDVAGNLDPTFGGTGVVRFQFTSCADAEHPAAIALQGDGKIVIAGSAYIKSSTYGFAVARLNPDGSLDSSFGNGGRVFFGFSQSTLLHAIALQSDGKIVLVGNSWGGSGSGTDFSVARLTTSGNLDSTFGSGGKVVVQTAKSGSGGCNGVAIQQINGEDRIVAVGSAATHNNLADFAIMRFTPTGALDASFGSGGKVFTDINGWDKASAVVVIGDSIMVGGLNSRDGTFPAFDFALAKYRVNGQLDTTFGNGGKVSTDFGQMDLIHAMALQGDGEIVAFGQMQYYPSSAMNFAIARYNSDGGLDSTFGLSGDGKVSTNYVYENHPNGLALQPDGRILAVGGFSIANAGSYEYVALVRYMP